MSTPRGINYFKILFDYGQHPTGKYWTSKQIQLQRILYIPAGEIEAVRSDMKDSRRFSTMRS